MGALTLCEVIGASGGRLVGDLPAATTFPRVVLDPGEVGPGDLFVAVPGERLDGHEFTVVAALRGAAAALVGGRWASGLRELPLPLIVVDDEPTDALGRIAAAFRSTLAATVVGITGSVGKTTTKEVVASVAGQRFRTHRTPGNQNNELGLPLSLLAAERDVEVVVLEIGGAYAHGEIAHLAGVAKPQIGIVTNVFPVHLERMGSLEAITATKAELVRALPSDGVAVLNGDDASVRAMARACRGSVLLFGRCAASDVRADHVRLHGLDGCSFDAHVCGEAARVQLPLAGAPAVEAALAALAVGHALGMALDEMLDGLRSPQTRIRPRRVPGPRGSLLLDDTYNASPPSVSAALGLLEAASAGRRIAVLGDMLELGALAEQEHERLGRLAAGIVDILVAYGDYAPAMVHGASRAAADANRPLVATAFEPERCAGLVEYLARELRAGDLALVKGSRALRMDGIVAALASDAEAS